MFKNSTYVGFTATPFANIFIDPESVDSMKQADLFPENFIYSLPTPSTYIGAKKIFYPDGDYYSNLRFISDIVEPDYSSEEYKEMVNEDVDTLNSGTFYYLHKKEWDGIFPDSLREATLCFFIANTMRDLRGDISAPRSMLINMSRFVKVQRVICDHIVDIYNSVLSVLKYDFSEKDSENVNIPLYKELEKLLNTHFSHVNDISSKRVLNKKALLDAISNIQIVVVNGSKTSSKLDYKSNPHLRVIAIGGLALSRGLTLEGLLTSYFYRNTATFDVLMQMGRWFGYRRKYEDLFQIWTSQSSALWYAEIAEASELLKEDIQKMYEQHLTPKDFGLKVRDNCVALQITASNKMRSASQFQFRVAYYGNMYDTPYLSLNAENNKENLRVTQELAKDLFRKGYEYRFADVERHRNDDPFSISITDSRYFSNVPKSVVRDYLTRIKCSLLNMNFNIESILNFIDDDNNTGLDNWDIVFEGGDGTSLCKIQELSNIRCIKRAIYDNGNAVQISSRRRILGTREGRFCLDADSIKKAETECRNIWISNGMSKEEAFKKDIPVKAYFKYLKERKPVLVILLIEPEVKPEEPGKSNGKAFKDFVKDTKGHQLIAFAIGFPGVRGEEAAVTYQVNKTWLRVNGLGLEENSSNNEEYDG